MLSRVGAMSGLAVYLQEVLSVDTVVRCKPSPVVFAFASQGLGIDPADLLFGSSNAWGVAGAKSFGYQVAWCNRAGAPAEELGAAPDLVITRLDELPA